MPRPPRNRQKAGLVKTFRELGYIMYEVVLRFPRTGVTPNTWQRVPASDYDERTIHVSQLVLGRVFWGQDPDFPAIGNPKDTDRIVDVQLFLPGKKGRALNRQSGYTHLAFNELHSIPVRQVRGSNLLRSRFYDKKASGKRVKKPETLFDHPSPAILAVARAFGWIKSIRELNPKERKAVKLAGRKPRSDIQPQPPRQQAEGRHASFTPAPGYDVKDARGFEGPAGDAYRNFLASLEDGSVSKWFNDVIRTEAIALILIEHAGLGIDEEDLYAKLLVSQIHDAGWPIGLQDHFRSRIAEAAERLRKSGWNTKVEPTPRGGKRWTVEKIGRVEVAKKRGATT